MKDIFIIGKIHPKAHETLNRMIETNQLRAKLQGDVSVEFEQFVSCERQHSFWYQGSAANILYQGIKYMIETFEDEESKYSLYSRVSGELITENDFANIIKTDDELLNALQGEEGPYKLVASNANQWILFQYDEGGNSGVHIDLSDEMLFPCIIETLSSLDTFD